jgi:hypothetical protein
MPIKRTEKRGSEYYSLSLSPPLSLSLSLKMRRRDEKKR